VTTEEELARLEDDLRRLKVEYDIYFGGGAKKAPTELDWRVRALLKKYSDSQKLTFSQRYLYNSMTERYAIFSDLWRKKMRIKEEGYRRPQDALLGIQGLRTLAPDKRGAQSRSAVLRFAESDELESVRELYELLGSTGADSDQVPGHESLEAFAAFLRAKTKQLQQRYRCAAVRYTVQVKDGRVKIKAKPGK
jgi:hypothetical protein